MSLSANQRYKESGSRMSFKDWLKSEQKEGVLDNHEKMYNANGKKEITTPKKAKTNMLGLNIIGVVALGCLVYGLSQVSES